MSKLIPPAEAAPLSSLRLEEITSGAKAGDPAWLKKQLDWIKGVGVQLDVQVGRASLTVDELFALKVGDSVKLETPLEEPVEIRLDGNLIARGVLVGVGDHFGVQITEIDVPKY